MAFCPHCTFMMPSVRSRITCPNCGRKKVRLVDRKPAFYSDTTAYEFKETNSGSFFSSFFTAGLVAVCGLGFLAIGLVVRGPLGLFCDFLGITATVVGAYCFYDVFKHCSVDRNPQKGYIDHLRDLDLARKGLIAKIQELEKLVDRQKMQGDSTRAASRLRLVSAALKNRKLKLTLIEETEFIIESKRKISRLQALAQEIGKNRNLRETDREIDQAFDEIRDWMKQAPRECQSAAGKHVKHALEQALDLNDEIQEQIEDRIVMRALEDGSDSDESFALEHVHDFLEKASIEAHFNALEIEESIAADEEYLKINAELRLMQDGLKHDFPSETYLDIDPLDEKMN